LILNEGELGLMSSRGLSVVGVIPSKHILGS